MKDFYGKKFWKIEKKNFEKIFTIFFFFCFKNFRLQILSSSFFFSEIFYRFYLLFRPGGREQRAVGGLGERSEPPAGGLVLGAERSVNSEFT